jgi:hypothetical protein
VSYIEPHLVRELLERALLERSLENLAASAAKPENFKRRAAEILHGRATRVTERVADEIAIVCGHPEFLTCNSP